MTENPSSVVHAYPASEINQTYHIQVCVLVNISIYFTSPPNPNPIAFHASIHHPALAPMSLPTYNPFLRGAVG